MEYGFSYETPSGKKLSYRPAFGAEIRFNPAPDEAPAAEAPAAEAPAAEAPAAEAPAAEAPAAEAPAAEVLSTVFERLTDNDYSAITTAIDALPLWASASIGNASSLEVSVTRAAIATACAAVISLEIAPAERVASSLPQAIFYFKNIGFPKYDFYTLVDIISESARGADLSRTLSEVLASNWCNLEAALESFQSYVDPYVETIGDSSILYDDTLVSNALTQVCALPDDQKQFIFQTGFTLQKLFSLAGFPKPSVSSDIYFLNAFGDALRLDFFSEVDPAAEDLETQAVHLVLNSELDLDKDTLTDSKIGEVYTGRISRNPLKEKGFAFGVILGTSLFASILFAKLKS